jgi:cardiolipin synthase
VKVVPNLLSVFRICLVPVFVAVYFTDENEIKYYAVLVFAIAGLSDILDGYIARKYEAQTNLGKLLDPLADKLMTFTALICIFITRPVILWAVLIFFVKEVLMGIGGIVLHKKARIELPPSNVVGKVSNTVFFVVCVALMFLTNLSDPVATILVTVATVLALIAFAGYIISYNNIMKSRISDNGEIECNQQSVQDVNETRQ